MRAIGAASEKHFDYVRSLGGEPILSRAQPIDVELKKLVPEGAGD